MPAYHYTTLLTFNKIEEAGYLKPGAAFVELPEKPILWFSSNPVWEETANKMHFVNGAIQSLTMEETKKLSGGLVRFAYPIKKLLPWRGGLLREAAKMPKKIAVGLEITAVEVGSNPNHWYGVLETVPLSMVTAIEILDEAGNWRELTK